jgi:hypothetical protein
VVTINGVSVTKYQLGLILDALSDSGQDMKQVGCKDAAEQYEHLYLLFRRIYRTVEAS